MASDGKMNMDNECEEEEQEEINWDVKMSKSYKYIKGYAQGYEYCLRSCGFLATSADKQW